MATHCIIQAIAACASVSMVVLAHECYDDEAVRAAHDYYTTFCRSFVCHRFRTLSPSRSLLTKAGHYLSGYPRHGFWNEAADAILASQMRETACDVLWCNSTHEAKYLPTAKEMGCKTVLMTHNVESELVRQKIGTNGETKFVGWVRWYDMRRLERFGARWADVVTGITDLDHDYYARLKGADRTFLLPFSYSMAENAQPLDKSQEESATICFVGSMDWPPNARAAEFLVHDVMPLVWKTTPEATCFLVGKNPIDEVRKLASDRVVVTGTVPSVHQYYERASLAVVPIQEVGGVKIKLFEAMAMGKAVVSTSAGTTGLRVEDAKQLRIADNREEFAAAILQLLKNPAEREALGERARRFVTEHLSPRETERQVQKILHLLEQL